MDVKAFDRSNLRGSTALQPCSVLNLNNTFLMNHQYALLSVSQLGEADSLSVAAGMTVVELMETQDPLERLTDRELEVFRLIGQGLTTGAIATQLFLSTHTIDTHRENIKRKLNAKTALELSRMAMQSMLENG